MAMQNEHKTIAKNTIMLYVRMILNMAISLYTSRVVLRTLGVEDFGIYGVVCGVLAMFSFFNASMSGATSRFLTYELGRNNQKKLAETFSTSLIVHCIIAILIALLCETIGIWFINNKLVIPSDRLQAAHIVFQFTVLSMFISVTQVPYNSSLFSHERMDIYAYIEIANSVLKLLIVYLLVIGNFDKLILFAVLNFLVTLLIALSYRFFCIHNYQECKFHLVYDKSLLKEMLAFSGWDLYGNLSVMARTQGVNMLLNMSFGPIMNAATEIATRVQNIIMSLATNVSIATRPQIVKKFAQGMHEEMISLIRDGARITFVLMMLFSVPLMCEIHYVLKLWLGNPPPHTELICVLTLLWNLVVAMHITIGYGVQATGKVKRVSLVSGTLFLLVIPITYLGIKAGLDYWIAFAYNVIAVVVAPYVGGGATLKRHLPGYSIIKVLLQDDIRDWCALFLVLFITYNFSLLLEESLIRLVATTFVSTILTILSAYLIVFPKNRRNAIKLVLREKLWKKIR